MICPFCLHKKSSVFNSRTTYNNTVTWRRRQCVNCNKTYTTQETIILDNIWHVRKINKKITKPYSHVNLLASLLSALDHREDYINASQYLLKIIEQILYEKSAKNNNYIQVTDIVSVTSNTLKNYDITAYIKYLSKYQPTISANTLRKQLKK